MGLVTDWINYETEYVRGVYRLMGDLCELRFTSTVQPCLTEPEVYTPIGIEIDKSIETDIKVLTAPKEDLWLAVVTIPIQKQIKGKHAY